MFGYIFNLFSTDKKLRKEEIDNARQRAKDAISRDRKKRKDSGSGTPSDCIVVVDVPTTPNLTNVTALYTESDFAGHGGSFGGGGASSSWDSGSSSDSDSGGGGD